LVYDRDPPRLLQYTIGSTRIEAVDKAIQERDVVLQDARARLLQAQQRMKNTYDSGHRELNFEIGAWVWLKLQPYRQLSVSKQKHHKLQPKFFGPFQVMAKVGSAAYKLQLPMNSRIHDVFHVSLLKEYKGPPPTSAGNLPPVFDGKALPTPKAALRSRINRGTRELLVQWAGNTPEEATWEPFHQFREAYPEFELEDTLNAERGSDDMDSFVGKQYQMKKSSNSVC
jgi:hypothetical protein